VTSFRHEHEYEALLRLTPYEELRANGSTGADHSGHIDELERQAQSDGLTITVNDGDDFGYIVQLVLPSLSEEEATRRVLFAHELTLAANLRGHDLEVSRAAGGRFSAGCYCGARL
jgi:hypothetical protein